MSEKRTVATDVEQTLEAVASNRAARTVDDVMGEKGSAYVESIQRCGFE